jgi:hypothetical protein
LFGLTLTRALIGINSIPVRFQDAFAFSFQVVELATVNRPAEDGDDPEHQECRERDEEPQRFHARRAPQRDARIALPMTSSELTAMPRPAAQGGSQPTRASGTQAAL